jgi:hypothetical protein
VENVADNFSCLFSFLKENEEKRATGRSKQQQKKIDILEALKDNGLHPDRPNENQSAGVYASFSPGLAGAEAS